jgi:cytochrome o ubiquinol oxidase operon protein cyoD
MVFSPSLRRDFLTYGIGYLLALALTGVAFAFVYFRLLPPGQGFAVILGLGFVQLLVHMRCFLHMGLARAARADMQLILFSALIIALMLGGTLMILFNLRMRMM